MSRRYLLEQLAAELHIAEADAHLIAEVHLDPDDYPYDDALDQQVVTERGAAQLREHFAGGSDPDPT